MGGKLPFLAAFASVLAASLSARNRRVSRNIFTSILAALLRALNHRATGNIPIADSAEQPLKIKGVWRATGRVQVHPSADISANKADSLEPGSLVVELESAEGFLRFTLLKGQGPSEGWVQCTPSSTLLTTEVTGSIPRSPATKRQKPVWIWAQGSRGDVQPLLALGVALQRRGFRTRLFASANFRGFVESRGLLFSPMGPDVKAIFQRVVHSEGFKRALNAQESLAWLGIHGGGDLWGDNFQMKNGPVVARALDEEEPQLVLFTPQAGVLPFLVWQRCGTPVCNVQFQPQLHSVPELRGYLGQLLSSSPAKQGCGIGVNAMDGCSVPKYLEWRESHKAYLCPPTALDVLVQRSNPVHTPELVKASRELCKGFLVLDLLDQITDLNEFGGAETFCRLQRYLDAGPPPVYVGWGSMPMHVSVLAKLISALKSLRMRAIVTKGWGSITLEALREYVGPTDPLGLGAFAEHALLFVDAVPHQWLLPRCAGVIHHGGAGTTCAAVRAGVPSIVTPYIVDQPMWAEWLCRQGVGLKLNILDQEDPPWVQTLQRLSEDKRLIETAKTFGCKMRAEDGVGAMVSFVEAAIRLSPNCKPPRHPESDRFGW